MMLSLLLLLLILIASSHYLIPQRIAERLQVLAKGEVPGEYTLRGGSRCLRWNVAAFHFTDGLVRENICKLSEISMNPSMWISIPCVSRVAAAAGA
uniref:Putative secreted protein n=1 Tax=Anopheles darlingi TaxID=43151 RepID=A0A2M4D5G4_ANODA